MSAITVTDYAVASDIPHLLPAKRTVALPATGAHKRRARLPDLAVAMADRLLEDTRLDPERSGILLGTGLGCLTETALFLENMIHEREALPIPRAFTASVHNAIASRVAEQHGLRGECHTVTHAELSLVHTLFASRSCFERGHGLVLAGALDERHPYANAAFSARGLRLEGEGGALFRLEPVSQSSTKALARIHLHHPVQRPRNLREWVAARSATSPATIVLFGGPGVSQPERNVDTNLSWIPHEPLTGNHHSAPALALAHAVGVVSGELDPKRLAARADAHTVALVTIGAEGEAAWIEVEDVR